MSKSNLISKIKELFAEEKFAGDYTAVTGEIIRCLGTLAVGQKVVQVLQGEEASLTDGEYVLDNGKSITVLGGEIKEINDTTASQSMGNSEETKKEKTEDTGAIIEKMADYAKEIAAKLIDGTEVKILSKGDALSVGDEVLVKDAAGEFVKAPSGKHILEGGLTIYVDEKGFINELETEETEEEDEMKKQMAEMFEAVSTMKSMIDELKSSLSSMKEENKTLTEKVNKFSAEPSVESVTQKKAFSKVASKEEKLKFFSARK